MVTSQGVVSFGGGPSPKSLPRNAGQTDGRKDKVVHSGAPPGAGAAHQCQPNCCSWWPPKVLEIREVVAKLWNGRVADAMGMKAEHLKGWLCYVKCEEAVDGKEGAGSRWRLYVSLIQAVWECGTVPTQMKWMVIVLLPKGRGDYHGIGLLNPMWKVVEKIMVARLSVIELHDCLHGALSRWGMGRAIIEVNLNQQLAWVEQEPLYQIYLDLKKAYDALD
jgi:hypothetical protein